MERKRGFEFGMRRKGFKGRKRFELRKCRKKIKKRRKVLKGKEEEV